ncbi:MAG: hypothetical protein JWM74_2513 [Myxococcaceae bacterium]|nr:hypothetical protein [Myxococcaceae bacterium]
MRERWRVPACSLLWIAACSKATPDPAPSSSATMATRSSSAPSVPSVASVPASEAGPAVPLAGGVKVSASAKVVDTSDWKGAPPGSTLYIRWTVDQPMAKPPITKKDNDDLTKHAVPLDLTLTLDGHSHAIALVTNGAPPYSVKCPSAAFFWAGMDILFEVERAEGGRAVVTRTETSESADTKVRQLHVFDVPAGVKVVQELVVLEPGDKRTSTKCSAEALP